MTKNIREAVLKFLDQRFGVSPPPVLYDEIALARDWWQGRHPPFHIFSETRQGMAPARREMYKMGMAKKICEDWATILINDKTVVRCENEAAGAALLGDRRGFGGLLTGGGFWGRLNAFVEQVFALGTGAVTVQLTGTRYDEDILTYADGMSLDFLPADQIFPLAAEGGEIVSCAFLTSSVGYTDADGYPMYFLAVHSRNRFQDGGNYWIVQNFCFDRDGKIGRLPDDLRGTFASVYPLFVLLTPNVVPSSETAAAWGMGESIFAAAYDNLKGVDLAYNNFCRDLYLGGKKVFMNQNLIQEDGNGRRIAPDDVAQQLFVTVGDSDLATDTMIVEHNPALRAEENCTAVQAQLDYLSFKVGFGPRHYRFAGERVVTATQYAGDRQELFQHACKHYLHMELFFRRLLQIAHWCASHLMEQDLPDMGAVTVDFDDSFFIDPAAERERDLAEVRAGLMAPWEYRVKYYGESPAAAKAMLTVSG